MARTLQLDADFDTLGTTSQNTVEDPEGTSKASQAMIDAAMGVRPEIPDPPDCVVTLAHGIKRDGVLLRDAEVRELTGEDEEHIAKVGSHWVRFMDALVSRGTVNIGGVPMTKEIGDELLVGDREDLILGIRRATFGSTLTIEGFTCGTCGDKSDLAVDLNAVPRVKLEDPDDIVRRIELRNNHHVEVRFVNGGDQRAIYSDLEATVAQSNTTLLSRCIVTYDGVSVGEPGGARVTGIVRKLGLADRKNILKYLYDNAPGPRFDQIEFAHDPCGTVIKLPLGWGDLFLGL